MKLMIHPITIKEANQLVRLWHRHHKPTQGALFAIGVAKENDATPCGAIIVGRPVARKNQDGFTCEATRCVTDGTRNACSILYGASWRASKAMGYRRLITYSLPQEGGASLRAAGFRCLGEAGGGTWDRADRPRVDMHPTQRKFKWMIEEARR